jgi:hypothetical protein
VAVGTVPVEGVPRERERLYLHCGAVLFAQALQRDLYALGRGSVADLTTGLCLPCKNCLRQARLLQLCQTLAGIFLKIKNRSYVNGLISTKCCDHGQAVPGAVLNYVPGRRSSNVLLSDSIEVFSLSSRISLSAMMF